MIEFRNVSKSYDNGTKALQNVNLRIDRGEFVFIVGSSGAGKSTFLKTIMREEIPTRGKILINNYNLTDISEKEIPYFRRTMGIVFQDFRLIPKMTVYDNVAFAMRVIGAKEKQIRKRVPYVLSLVGLNSKARCYPSEISGGEKQRVALARALVNNANIIIADEPTGNIDPEMSYDIVDLLNHINANGTTVIMVTHEHDLVYKFNHRVVAMEQGVIVSDTANGDNMSYTPVKGYDSSAYSKNIELAQSKGQRVGNNQQVQQAKQTSGNSATQKTISEVFTVNYPVDKATSEIPLQQQTQVNTQDKTSNLNNNNETNNLNKSGEIDYSKYLEHLNESIDLGVQNNEK